MSKPVGIIGSACRFPGGANSPSKLWELLKDPKDVVSEFPPDRLNLSSFYHENGEHHGSTDVENKSYLLSEDIRLFDASFFRISPSEADAMDPQQRILLETVYEALESSGCTLDQVRGSLTSVYAGLMNGDYADIQARDLETIPTHHGTGTHRSILSNRVSYFLDVKGASMTIDTACSSSLVALHQAVQSLRLGESDMAIVGGANLLLDPTMYVAESKLHMLSPDSRSRMWDAAANGYARGEGFAAIVLKPIEAATRDGNQIECVIRGTAVNSDGRTAGITVPSASAQTALIRQAYKDAGLNPLIDRCQFFEAHGTGTRVGDPIEARAIRDAFFPEVNECTVAPGKLLVGSIKTVVGHLEGCAGLAGVLKASLAMQNRTIPPNIHLSELNPAIAPLYDHLEVPTKASTWPAVPQGSPLRTSVNSFGFGGTNAHVILETFEEGLTEKHEREQSEDERFVGPLLLSANSQGSLVRLVEAYADYIRKNKQTDLRDLTWTLQSRRTHFGNSRVFFSGATRKKLLSYMDTFVTESSSSTTPSAGSRGEGPSQHLLGDDGPAILGIFTGQGAQWPSMGRNLILHSPLFQETIARCEASLAALGADAPSWSLVQELLAEGSRSRIGEAAISQPLCTAVQIGLVDVLHASGIMFRGVVGHSSGEIAAVYAAGIISAHDAIRIAYYRGFHAKLAKGPAGQGGAMLAAGMSHESAAELCAMPEYTGRVRVAAANAPNSVTLSGDADAIDQLKAHLESEKTFARKLNVDTAYHSHHMEPCSAAYLASLKACNIQVQQPDESCVWVSSVWGDADIILNDEDDSSLDILKDQYWVDNLLSPVLFAPAVESSLWRAGPFDIVTEVGPHPALKGPSTQIFKASLGSSMPYFSIMRRGDDEVEAFSGGLGYLWEHFGPTARIDFDGYRRAFDQKDNSQPPQLVKGLPSYCWDHGRVHWRESRNSHNFRLRDRRVHEMDHAFQGQIVLPGAAYVAAITEAAQVLADGKPINLVELIDLEIPKAVVLHENKATELTTSLRLVHRNGNFLCAEFVFSAAPVDDAASTLERTCSGTIEIHIGDTSPSHSPLPLPSRPPPNLNTVDTETLYTKLRELGIDYQGLFRATKLVQRTMGYASTQASWGAAELGNAYTLHPAILDVGFHAVLAAFASPLAGQMWTMYLPVGIRRVTIHPDSLPRSREADVIATISAQITSSSVKGLDGDMQIMFGSCVGVQVEGVKLQTTGDAMATKERMLFSNTCWDSDLSTGIDKVVLEQPPDRAADEELVEAMGRTALYYYRKLLDEISPRELQSLPWHQQIFWQSAQYWVNEVNAGRHPTIRREWLEDSYDTVWKQAENCAESIDIRMMRALGKNLPSIARGETQPLEIMMENDMLSHYYVEAYGLDGMNDHIARAVSQITHRYPQASILEIGAGVGGTTRKVLRRVQNSFKHYTFSDISSGFFEKGAEKFSDYRHKMTFKVCDIEKDPVDQGLVEGGYDVIVAANVLHATRCLANTMRNVRRLLKPGGFLIMMEITGDLFRLGFIMGTLPGWWLGPRAGDEGRQWAPGISPVQWDDLLLRTGFSGVDQFVPDHEDSHKHYLSTLVSQAVDDQFDMLRSPLSDLKLVPALPHKLLILGGQTLTGAKLVRSLKKLLADWDTPIETVSSLDLLSVDPDERMSIISLIELDQPLFANELTAAKLKTLQDMLNVSETVLWATAGCRGSNPTSNMFVGIARALRTERGDINLQLLDVRKPLDANPARLAECFLRLSLMKDQTYVDKPMLWSTEAELALDGDTLLIPRLVPNGPRNERYNASRRTIKRQVTLARADVEVDTNGGTLSLLGVDSDISRSIKKSHGTEQSTLKVHLSMELPHSDLQYFLYYGFIESECRYAFAVSRENKSSITCTSQDSLVVDLAPIKGKEASMLDAMTSQLTIRSLAMNVPPQGAVLIYEPPSEGFARAVECNSLWKGRKVYYATCRSHTSPHSTWISIGPHALSSAIRKMLPANITVLVDFSTPESRDIRGLVPAGCVIRHYEPSLLKIDSKELESAYADALVALSGAREAELIVRPLRSLPGIPTSTIAYPALVDWREQQDEPFTVQVKPFAPSGIFSSCKTHLMVGLNGDLGQSICGYMIRNGAQHIAISSRRGEVDPVWLDLMRNEYHADVRVYKMDVTSRQSIRETIDQIKAEMPPIGGVANGAMVLHDKMFLNMDVDSLNNTLKPKVEGSRYLDEMFSTPELDYFILFSSVATVGNNRGQANYHAANLFGASLVSNRRVRGLAGSVIHVGVIADAGYITRQDPRLVEHLRKQGFMPTSEIDAHFLFAEGVLASPVDSQMEAEICMGLEPFEDSPDDLSRPPWYNDSRLSHFILSPEENRADSRQLSGGALHIRQKLDEAQSVQEAHSLLQEAFSAKLESMMQLSAGSVNIHVPLLDLGFDSLLAVETRTWFLKEIHVDVPVLRFLGGDTIHEICVDTTTQYLAMQAECDPEKAKPEMNTPPTAKASNTPDVKDDGRLQATPPAPASENGEPYSSSRTSTSLDAQNIPDSPSTPLSRAWTPTSTPEVEEKTALSNVTSDKPKAEIFSGTPYQGHMMRNTSRVEAMSYAQSRLWFLDQYLDSPTTCNIAVSYAIRGPLNVTRLREALDKVIAHHASLQTCFYVDEETGEPMQGLLRSASNSSPLRYLHASSREEVQHEFDALRDHEWDLANGDTFAATLLSTDRQNEFVIIFGYHHIVIDGVSWYTILQDLERSYTLQPLSQQGKQYMDASVEQRQAVESGALDNEISFWETVHATLPDVLPLLPVASVRRRQPLRRYESHTIKRDIGRHLVAKIKNASRSLRVTPFNFYLATVQVLFSKMLDIKELCIGVTDASRTDDDLANTVGFFLNILPLRFQLDRQRSFTDLVRQTSRHVLEGRGNSRVPIDVILDRLNVPRDASFNPLFQVTFNYRVGAMAETSLGKDCHLSVEAIRDAESPFDLGFGIYETAEGSCDIQVISQSCLYDRGAADLIMTAYVQLLDLLSSDTSRKLGQYSIFDASDIQKGISMGKGERKTYDWPDTLSKRVDTMMKSHKDSIAISDSIGSLTYGQLEGRIRLVELAIQKESPAHGSRIAVLCEPSTSIIISMLAILRLGHVYVPLDTNLPKERHSAILTDCKPAVVICHQETLESTMSLCRDFAVVNVSTLSDRGRLTDTSTQDDRSQPNSPAFLFYTSGSTGKPKGIELSQFGFLNHFAVKTDELSLQRETVLQQSSFGFDMSLTQIFCALANGGLLVIVPAASRGDPIALSKLMLKLGVTFTIATPSEYSMWLRYGQEWLRKCTDWTHACMGGEEVTQQLVQAFTGIGNANIQLTNCYGPTETSLAVTFDRLSRKTVSQTSVGRILPNYSVYILDENSSEPVPLGHPGEICVGGAGVALGYLNLPDLSAAKFVLNPFADAYDVARGWTRMFRTGDRGRLRADGTLVFMGRKENDNMIKLRGLRIDLDDVANTIVQTADDVVAEAIVTTRGEDEARMLVAHVVLQSDDGKTLAAEELQKLAQRLPLPAYMRPSLIVAVDRLPQTPNGKVDRKAIESMDLPRSEQKDEGSCQKLSLEEGELSLLWEEVLGQSLTVSRTGLTSDSDFFLVGGSSLLLMQLQGAIREILGLTVPITELYRASTLRRMAAHLHSEKGQQDTAEQIDWEREAEVQALSPTNLTTCNNPIRETNLEVLLTGAHTFLGAEILQTLVKDSNVKRVHCIALPKTASKSLSRSGKMTYYPGTLQSESLGLSSGDISFLQSRIDLIIHAGSVGHCLNNYSSLRQPNVGSLRFLVNLALPRHIPVHFISSNRVTLLSGQHTLPPVSIRQHQPPRDGSEGYTASKWAGEQLLENIAQRTGLDVTIHRPCAVIGCNAPSEDALNALLRFAVTQNAVPRFGNLTGFLDFAPVTDVAANIARVALKRDHHDRSGTCMLNAAPIDDYPVTVVHHSSGIRTPVSEFRGRMQELYGREFGELDIVDWIVEAVKQGMDPLISTYLEALVKKDQIIAFPYLGEPLTEGV
ncbi:hybrid PKS-NRPS [Aspergillus bertholletiae]|uniref:Hybrid PKS-NRPS n=1 Tax=Aspergillus bertholletiae TaxID=1226010 RepID=A0A5N7BNX0_9EURO|nr:hybrid PKS-NRPS [Aspergillus bertholletiae]